MQLACGRCVVVQFYAWFIGQMSNVISDRLGLAVLFSTIKTAFLLYLSSICLESDGVYIASTRLSTLEKKYAIFTKCN